MTTLAILFGTRPEVIKQAPIVLEARRRSSDVRTFLLCTGQHTEMSHQALELFGLKPHVDLGIMTKHQRPEEVLSRVLMALLPHLIERKPELLLIQGDTTSALAGALGAFHLRIPVGHVEAGLRTDDMYDPFPEEMNRRLITRLSSFHFSPTAGAAERLVREGVTPNTIFVTGNTVIDALLWVRKYGLRRPPGLEALPNSARVILLTCHRRENHGEGIYDICAAVRQIVDRFSAVHVVFPVHPSPAVRPMVEHLLKDHKRIHLLSPLDYAELVWLMDRAEIVLTDSGGIQEEAPSLGKPVLVLRRTTERPEGIDIGNAILVGSQTDRIVSETSRLLKDRSARQRMARIANPYGDGHAAKRIVDILISRPTAGSKLLAKCRGTGTDFARESSGGQFNES